MSEEDLKLAFLRVHLLLCVHMGYAADNAEHHRNQS